MRWLRCFFIACNLLNSSLHAQWLEKPLLPCCPSHIPFSSAIEPSRPADILHYRLSLQLTMQNNFLQGSNQIRFQSMVPALRRLSLSAAQMTIDSITLQPNHERLHFSHQGDSLHIDLPSPLTLNDSATLTIYYHATPNRRLLLLHHR